MERSSTSSTASPPLHSNLVQNAIGAGRGATGVEAFLARAELSKVCCLGLLTPSSILTRSARIPCLYVMYCNQPALCSLPRIARVCTLDLTRCAGRNALRCHPPMPTSLHSRVSPASHVSILYLHLIAIANMSLSAIAAESRAQSSAILCIVQSQQQPITRSFANTRG